MTGIGFGKVQIASKDSSDKSHNEYVGYVTSDCTVYSDTAVAVDSWARAVNGLTTHTYDDTKVSFEISINEQLAD